MPGNQPARAPRTHAGHAPPRRPPSPPLPLAPHPLQGFVKDYEAAKAAADAAGTVFDTAAAIGKVRSALEVEKADAILDAAAAARKAAIAK